MSNPGEDDWKKMIKLVDSFYNRADAEPFRAPVDWKAYVSSLLPLLRMKCDQVLPFAYPTLNLTLSCLRQHTHIHTYTYTSSSTGPYGLPRSH